jgi:hypothetical protein
LITKGADDLLEQTVLQDLYTWFSGYVKSFYSTDDLVQPNIILKEQHSLIVADMCRNLAHSLAMSEADTRLAEAVGLCHDAGRFRQFTIYHTFRDSLSVNHGSFGVEELRVAGVDRIAGPEEWQIIAFAVGCHNAMAIPDQPDPRRTTYAKMVRDADKLDIYRVLPPQLASDGYSTELFDQLLTGGLINYERVKTAADYNLVMLSWVYDINFSWTLQQISCRGYIPRLLETLPPSPQLSRLQEKLADYIASRTEADCR